MWKVKLKVIQPLKDRLKVIQPMELRSEGHSASEDQTKSLSSQLM